MKKDRITNLMAICHLRNRIQEVLQKHAVTQTAFAKFLGMHKQQLNEFLNRRRSFLERGFYERLVNGIHEFNESLSK